MDSKYINNVKSAWYSIYEKPGEKEIEEKVDGTRVLSEPATSKAQQQAAAVALSAKRGEIPVSDLKGASKEMYDGMTEKELEDFASTKHKGLPDKKEAMDPVNKKALKKDFDDREDKDIDNDGDVDSSDKYLHNRRKEISKAMKKESAELDEAKGARPPKLKGNDGPYTRQQIEKAAKEAKVDIGAKSRMMMSLRGMKEGLEEEPLDEAAKMSAKSKEWYDKGYQMGLKPSTYKSPPYGIGGAAMDAFRKGRKAGEAAAKNKNEEVELDEIHDRYMRSHGKKASGRGRWMFTDKRMGDVDHKDMYHHDKEDTVSKAAAAARKHFGTKDVYVMEEVELDEGKLDKSSPIYKEYEALKKKSVDDLRNIVGRSHRTADLKGYDKAGAIRQILDDKHGEKKVDAFFGFSEEAELDEISKKTLGSYVKKAGASMAAHGVAAGAASGKDDYNDRMNKASRNLTNRLRGLHRAADRLAKEGFDDMDAPKGSGHDPLYDIKYAIKNMQVPASALKNARQMSKIIDAAYDMEMLDPPRHSPKVLDPVLKKNYTKLLAFLKKNEEVELGEANKGTTPARYDMIKRAAEKLRGDGDSKAARRDAKRAMKSKDAQRGMAPVKTEASLDEISPKLARKAAVASRVKAHDYEQGTADPFDPNISRLNTKAYNATKHVQRRQGSKGLLKVTGAANRVTYGTTHIPGWGESYENESTRQIDEVSAKLARKAAAASAAKSFEYGSSAYGPGSDKETDRLDKKADKARAHVQKRQGDKGVKKVDRMTGKLIYGKSRAFESSELEEGRNEVLKALASLAKKPGMDKKDYQKAHDMYKAAKYNDLKKHIYYLDTDPSEQIAHAISQHDSKTFNSMYPRAKSGDYIRRIVLAHPVKEEVELDEAQWGVNNPYMKYDAEKLRMMKAKRMDNIGKMRNRISKFMGSAPSGLKDELKDMEASIRQIDDAMKAKRSRRNEGVVLSNAIDKLRESTAQGPSDDTRDSFEKQLSTRKGEKDFVDAHKIETPEYADGPTVTAKTFNSFMSAVKAAPKRPNDSSIGDKGQVKNDGK